MSLCEYTFGNRKCAVNLAKMLNEQNSPSLTRRISCFVASYNSMAKMLQYIPRAKERHRLTTLVIREANAHEFIDTPYTVGTHAKNVAIGNLKHYGFDLDPKIRYGDTDVSEFFNFGKDEMEFEDEP